MRTSWCPSRDAQWIREILRRLPGAGRRRPDQRTLAVVLYSPADGPARPGELRRQIGGISQKVLTETLRRLEHNGLVERRRYAEAPPRVEYSLTTAGKDLLVPIRALGDWAAAYADQLPTENKP